MNNNGFLDPLTVGRILALLLSVVMSGLGLAILARKKMTVWGIWLFGFWAANQVLFCAYSLFAADLKWLPTLVPELATFWTVILRNLTYSTMMGYLLIILMEKGDNGRWKF